MKQHIKRYWPALVWLAFAPVVVLVITTPMSLENQALFGVLSALLVVLIGQVKARRILIALILITAVSSTRYLYWRVTQTLVTDGIIESILSFGLLAAECYAWLVLLLAFFQTARPLERQVVPLPDDVGTWPTVDVYIPTYNESLAVVRDTVLAAQNIDYPADKMHIYLLDDGKRPEFGAFASAAGVGYITRSDNAHAKAGNLNNAMKQTDGELICIFDCDHVPTRGFLQATAGAFLVDEKLALLQTPHHFYSPDPFERNLVAGRKVPHEGELFYGPVQKGNDFWNAAFFCGSCALIRRTALEETDGFAVETVTEDAHTALKLQRKGWSTAFLGIPLAAGLATERLTLHIGQRARWCRGMIQILRRDNPLTGPGLSLPQRLCYLSAMLHFQFPLARVVFLTAPLAYLLFGLNIIEAAPQAVAAYVLPHLFCIVYTNSRAVGKFRYTFWNEIYETVLAFHLLKPSLVTLFDPKRGKFNVTEKGGLLQKGFIDFQAVQPHIFVLVLLLVGTIWGVIRVFWWDFAGEQVEALLFNIAWAALSALFLLAAVAVASETRQIRKAPRIDVVLPAVLHLASGHTLRTTTRNLSMGGAQMDKPEGLADEAIVEYVETSVDGQSMIFPVKAVAVRADQLHLQFAPLPLSQQRELVGLVMGRPDAWLRKDKNFRDRPLQSMATIAQSIFGLFFVQWRDRRLNAGKKTGEKGEGPLDSWVLRILLLLLIVLGVLGSQHAWSQASPSTPAEGNRTAAFSLGELSGSGNLRLQGNGAQAGLDFSLRRDQVVTDAQLLLDMRYSEKLLDDVSYVEVLVNGVSVKRILLNRFNAEGLRETIDIPAQLMVLNNTLQFRLAGETREQCDNLLSEDIWLQFTDQSRLTVVMKRIPPAKNLAQFPAPFFDSGDMKPLSLPMVLAKEPSSGAVEAASIVASYMGVLADWRATSYPVWLGELPASHAFVFLTPDDDIPGLTLPVVRGPSLFQVAHPYNPLYRLLIITGRNAEELRVAARYLAQQGQSLQGQQVVAESLEPPARGPNDAPRWQHTRTPIYLVDLAGEHALTAEGIRHAANRFGFRLPPDLFIWPGDDVKLNLQYRFPQGDWLDIRESRLEVMLNGQHLESLPAVPRGPWPELQRLAGIDTHTMAASLRVPPEILYGNNELSLYFDVAVADDEDCDLDLPDSITATILPTSHLDISEAYTFTPLPELSLFANAGFPFTRMADLSETAVLLPAKPEAAEISALLELLSGMGAATGYPALALEVYLGLQAGPRLADKDLLIVASLPALNDVELLQASPFKVGDGKLQLRPEGGLQRVERWLRGDLSSNVNASRRLDLLGADNTQALLSFVSPLNDARAAVVVTARHPETMTSVVAGLEAPKTNADVQGDLALFESPGTVHSYSVGPVVGTGNLPWYMRVRWQLSGYVLPMLLAMVFIVLVASGLLYTTLERRAQKRIDNNRNAAE